jgi:hypothetical protein
MYYVDLDPDEDIAKICKRGTIPLGANDLAVQDRLDHPFKAIVDEWPGRMEPTNEDTDAFIAAGYQSFKIPTQLL